MGARNVRRGWRAAVVTGLLGAAACADAHATPTAPGSVRPGHNVGVFHEIDFVSAFGHTPGGRLTIEVFRGDVRIARVTAPALASVGGLEVNHGPDGVAVPGDCWPQRTPDIRPFDRVRVTDAQGGVDEVLVDDIVVEDGPRVDSGAPDDVILTGHARSALGGPIGAALEAEFRNTSKLRGGPTRIERPTEDTFKVVYTTPAPMQRGGPATAAQLTAPAAQHTVGFGHIDPAAPETQIADAGGAPGPAPGCEAIAPAAGRNAATVTDDDIVGPLSGDLTVGGTAVAGVSAVAVTLDDGPGGGDPVVAATSELAAGPNAPGDADRGWSVTFTEGQLAGFGAEADLTLTPAFAGAGEPAAAPLTIRRDTVAPAPPVATPGAGTYTTPLAVRLGAEPGAAIHYTTDGSVPTTASPRLGGRLDVDRSTTIRAIAVDAAGNVSAVATFAYTVAARTARRDVVDPVVLQVVAGPAPIRLVALAPAPGIGLRISGLSAPARVSARVARRAGLVASFVPPAGARYAEARLYRAGDGLRRLVARRVMAATPGRRQTARFAGAAVRRRLAAGRYAIQVRVGPSPSRLGPVRSVAVRITR